MDNGGREGIHRRGCSSWQRDHLRRGQGPDRRVARRLDWTHLYGQLLRRMPTKEIGESNTRFAVVVPKGSEAAALRVPSRVRDLLRIDVYVVSDEGDVEIQIGD